MKRIVAVMFMILAIGLTGCGSNGTTVVDTEKQEVEVYEDDYIKVSYIEIFEEKSVQGACYLKFNVENKSDEKITVYPIDSYVNDSSVQMGSGVPMTIEPGKQSQNPFYIPYSNAGVENMDAIEKIELKLMLMNESSETIEETDVITVNK